MLTVFLVAYFFVAAATALQDNSAEDHATDPAFAHTCPRLCVCYWVPLTPSRSVIIVQCHKLSDFPSTTPRGTASLVLHDSTILRIADTSLQQQSLRLLEDLECSGCRITFIDATAFHSLRKLKSIILSNNSITDLGPEHFVAQKHLVVLDLIGNPGLDCDHLKKGLPRTRVLCDAITKTLTDVAELVTAATADSHSVDSAEETESLPRKDNDTASPTTPTDETDKETAIPSGSHLWLGVGLFLGAVVMAGSVLAIVYRRQTMDACRKMAEKMRQDSMSLLKDRKVETHEDEDC